MLKFERNIELGVNTKFVLGLHRAKQLGLEYPLGSLGMGNIGIDSFTQGWTNQNKNPSWSWSFFSSNYSPRAEAGAFRLQFSLPELELEFCSLDFFIELALELTSF